MELGFYLSFCRWDLFCPRDFPGGVFLPFPLYPGVHVVLLFLVLYRPRLRVRFLACVPCPCSCSCCLAAVLAWVVQRLVCLSAQVCFSQFPQDTASELRAAGLVAEVPRPQQRGNRVNICYVCVSPFWRFCSRITLSLFSFHVQLQRNCE